LTQNKNKFQIGSRKKLTQKAKNNQTKYSKFHRVKEAQQIGKRSNKMFSIKEEEEEEELHQEKTQKIKKTKFIRKRRKNKNKMESLF
jgi:hypothetical protein